ncbi:MAG TPA: 2Fe-2S iron-sulfur cluster binding domain-containing protein [Pyrinomonadaceae bacterium]|jgi:ferredoxin
MIEIKFEVENQPERSGVVPEGTYLWDAAKRLGVHLKAECDGRGACDTCAVTISKGREMLSTATSAEMQHLTDERRANGERLACQTRIERNGELTVMVKKQEVEEEEETKQSSEPRDFRKDFQELPFEKKFATLVQIEAVALSETLNYVSNLPSFVAGKIMDVIGAFGKQMDEQKRAEKRPDEHKTSETNGSTATAE